MQVLMITTDHLMIDRRILQEAQTLRQAGYGVALLAGFECSTPEAYEQDGISIARFTFDWSDSRLERIFRWIPLQPGRLRSWLWIAARRLIAGVTGLTSFEHFVLRQVMARDYDILHCHDFPLLNVAVEAKRRRPTPLVYDAHELYHAQSQLPARVRRRYRRREARLIRRVDLAITVNPFLARIMAEDYGCEMPEVILNAAIVPSRSQSPLDLRKRLGLSPLARIVIYQGWFSPERGLVKLVEMARHFPANVHLVMVGYGAHELDLRAVSAAQGTDDGRVMFLGRIEPEELARLTPSADLGVIPYHGIDLNHRYSSPNKLFEFLAAGVPFVSNDLPFLRTVVDTYGCGFVVDFAASERAANQILARIDDPEAMSRLKQAATAAARVLNWEVEGRKLLALYNGVRAAQTAM